MTDVEYGVHVSNKYALFLDDAPDPSELFVQLALAHKSTPSPVPTKDAKGVATKKKDAEKSVITSIDAPASKVAKSDESTIAKQTTASLPKADSQVSRRTGGGKFGGESGQRREDDRSRGGDRGRGRRGGRGGRGGGGGFDPDGESRRSRGGGGGGGAGGNLPPRMGGGQGFQNAAGPDDGQLGAGVDDKFGDRFGEGPRGRRQGGFPGRPRNFRHGGGGGGLGAGFGGFNGGGGGDQSFGGSGGFNADVGGGGGFGIGVFGEMAPESENKDVAAAGGGFGGFGSGFGGGFGEPNLVAPTSERGRGRGRSVGRGGGRGNRGGGRGRQFDRQSGSDRSGVKSVDKRDGGGAHNWGAAGDELELGASALDDSTAALPQQGDAADGSALGGDAAGGERRAEDENQPTTENMEPAELTLDEWKALQGPRQKPAFNVRRPGEGEGDKKEWKGLVPLPREMHRDAEPTEEMENAEGDKPRKAGSLYIPINFIDETVRGNLGGGPGGRGAREGGGPRRGTGGRGRGGGGRGFGRGFGGSGGGFGPPLGERRGPTRPSVPYKMDEETFPTLAAS